MVGIHIRGLGYTSHLERLYGLKPVDKDYINRLHLGKVRIHQGGPNIPLFRTFNQGIEKLDQKFFKEESLTKQIIDVTSNEKGPFLQRFEDNLKALMADFPDGFSSYKLKERYAKKFGHEFDYEDHNCTSIAEFCMMLPNIFTLK